MADVLNTLNEKLKTKFGSDILSAEQLFDFPVFTVKKEKILEIIKTLKEEEGFNFLTDLTGTHYPDNKGQELGVIYHLHDMPGNRRIRLKTYASLADPKVLSLTGLFPGANWMERETFDFYGVLFTGHPNLKRILNMDEMNYFPMRREYPMEDAKRDDKDNSMFGR